MEFTMKELFTKAEIQASTANLKTFLPDKDVYNGILFQQFCNITVTQDFTRKSIKRACVAGSHFLNCNFNGVAAAGSKFFETTFGICNFEGSNFQYCSFHKVQFKDSSIFKGANLSHSVFVECDFSDITIQESTLYDCYFENCSFCDSVIKTNTLENTTMCNCTIQNIDLAHINLEYMRFDKIKMTNVILPPYQIPYIIGAPTYLKYTDDSINIYTDNGEITHKAYCKKYNDLAAYFFSQKLYFPLANILIANERYSDAFNYIRLGIEEACDYFDFRIIKHYCRLACSDNHFTYAQLKVLYDLVTGLSYNKSWDVNTLHSYMLNIGEIRELLLNNSENKQRVDFIIKTNINKDDLDSINLLYNQVNKVIKESCSNMHIDSIELRHNSPYELYVTCIDILPNILLVISSMYSLFVVARKGLDLFKNYEDVIRVHQQNKLFEYELEEKKLDIELKKEQLKQVQKEKSGIITTSVIELEHILKCNSVDTAKKITPEYLHYKVSNIPE